jgi:hypothetical protein
VLLYVMACRKRCLSMQNSFGTPIKKTCFNCETSGRTMGRKRGFNSRNLKLLLVIYTAVMPPIRVVVQKEQSDWPRRQRIRFNDETKGLRRRCLSSIVFVLPPTCACILYREKKKNTVRVRLVKLVFCFVLFCFVLFLGRKASTWTLSSGF